MFGSKQMKELLCNYSCLRNYGAELLEVNVILISSEAKEINQVSLSNITTTALHGKQRLVRVKPQRAGDIQACSYWGFSVSIMKPGKAGGRVLQHRLLLASSSSVRQASKLQAPWLNVPAANGFSGDIPSHKIN